MVALAYGLAVGLAGRYRGHLWGHIGGRALWMYTATALAGMASFLYLIHYWYVELPAGSTTLQS